MSGISILIVDSSLSTLKSIRTILKQENIAVTCADTSALAVELMKTNTFDLILLDICMPEQDGLSLLKKFRQTRIYTPIIMLTKHMDDTTHIQVLYAGADDCIEQPLNPSLLVAKIRALIRRDNQYAKSEANSDIFYIGPFTLQMNTLTIEKNGNKITLTSREFSLLYLFLCSPEVIFSKQDLLEQVWHNETSDDSIILVYIKKLRDKIEDDPSHPVHIRTVWGKGYQFFL